MQYAKINGGVIIHIIDTTHPEDLCKPCNNEGCTNEGVWDTDNPMPDDNQAHVGDDVRMFTPDWKLRPLQDLVNENLITLATAAESDPEPTGTILERVKDNRIVAKTRYDFVKEGIAELQPLEYLDDELEKIQQAESVEDLLALGKIHPDDAQVLKAAEIRDERNSRLGFVDELATHALRWASLDDHQREQVAQYRQALLNVPQQAQFPWSVSWPQKPDWAS